MTRLQMLEKLKELQETPNLRDRDIRTITAMMSNEALAKHVEVCEQKAGEAARTAGGAARH